MYGVGSCYLVWDSLAHTVQGNTGPSEQIQSSAYSIPYSVGDDADGIAFHGIGTPRGEEGLAAAWTCHAIVGTAILAGFLVPRA